MPLAGGHLLHEQYFLRGMSTHGDRADAELKAEAGRFSTRSSLRYAYSKRKFESQTSGSISDRRMQHTLVAVFDNSTDAQKAMNELLSSGFHGSEMRLSSGDSSIPARDSPTSANEDGSIGDSIKSFFSDLFGSAPNDRSAMYSDAVSRRNCVLTVTTRSEPEVERAADLIEGFDPINIDKHRHAQTTRSALSQM